jgi:hypothetical protein
MKETIFICAPQVQRIGRTRAVFLAPPGCGVGPVSEARLRGLLETEHVFRRAAEPHDPTGLGLSFSADDLPRAVEGVSRRSPGVASLPIQLRQASYGVEVRTRDEDAGDPGWTDDAAAELKRNLLVANCFFGSGEDHICIRSLQHLVHCRG